MLALTTLFEIEKNKKTGAKPVWILKIPFVSGTLYLSDRAVIVAGWGTSPTTLPWIASWGSIDEDISSQLVMPMVSDFSVSIIIDPDAATDIHDLLWSESVETIDCSLYLWFEGLNGVIDPPILRWVGNIIDFEKMNELVYQVSLVDQGVKLDNYPGRVLSLVDYPRAALDDVGYQMTLLYGNVAKVPALRLDVAKRTALVTDITASQKAFSLVDAIGLTSTSIIVIENEEIALIGLTGNNITDCTRASNGAGIFTALSQTSRNWAGMAGAIDGDIYATDYQAAGTIYKRALGTGDFVDVAPNIGNAWYFGITGAPDGDIYVAVYNGWIYKQTNGVGNWVVEAGSSVQNWVALGSAPNGNIYGCVSGTDIYMQTNGAGNFVDLNQIHRDWRGIDGAPNGNVYACVYGGDIYKQTAGAGDFIALGGTNRNWQDVKAAPNGNIFACDDAGDIYMQTNGTGNFIALSQTSRNWKAFAIPPNGDVYCSDYGADIYQLYGLIHSKDTLVLEKADGVYLFADHPVKSIDTIYGQELDSAELSDKIVDITSGCTKYTGQGGANDLAGYAGMAVIACPYTTYITAERLLITGKGYQDGGAVLIERPDLIMEHFLYNYAGWATANFEHAAAAAFLTADGYTFSVVIQERKQLREWLEYMAFQCRCWFRFASGKAYLLYRPDIIISDKTITGSMIAMNEDNTTTLTLRRSPLDEIINIVHLYYNRDWSRSAGREAYQAITRTENAASILAYGEKERADTFLFDFVTDATMAIDLRDFYLARYKDRKKVVTLTAFLDNFELEFADGVTLASTENLLCEVRKVGITPGGTGINDKVLLTAREY